MRESVAPDTPPDKRWRRERVRKLYKRIDAINFAVLGPRKDKWCRIAPLVQKTMFSSARGGADVWAGSQLPLLVAPTPSAEGYWAVFSWSQLWALPPAGDGSVTARK